MHFSDMLLTLEVKDYQVTIRDCGPFPIVNDPQHVPPPEADPLAVCPEYQGGPGLANHDVDVLSVRERYGGPTFAAITSRSFHPGAVMSLLADGSVRFVPQTIAGSVCRALGTIAGGEVIAGG